MPDRPQYSFQRLLTATVWSTISAILPVFLTGALAVQLEEDLGFGAAALGMAVAVYFASAAVTSAMLGRMVERLGSGRTLRVTSSLAAVVLLGAATSPSWGILVAWLAIGGIVNATAQPAANVLLARAVDPARQGLAFGIKQSGMPAATLLAGLAVPTLAVTVGWRYAYVAGGLVALVAAVLAPVRADTAPPARPAGTRRAGDAPMGPLVVLAIGVGLGAGAAGALAAFLVSAAVDAGMDDGAAGLLLTAGSAVGIVVRLVVGARADRRSGGHLRVVAVMLLGGAAAFVGYALGAGPAVLIATPFAFGLGWAWPGLFNYSVIRLNPGAPGLATGITQTGTYVGAVLGPLAFGALAGAGSYRLAWLTGAACYVLAAVAMIVGRHLVVRARAAGAMAPAN